VKEQVEEQQVQILYMPTKNIVADVLTKPLLRQQHQVLTKQILNE
jgi:hypothetical protein